MLVNAQALLANRVKKSCRIVRQNLTDRGIAEHRMQASDPGCQFIRRAPPAGTLDRFHRVADAVDCVTNGMGKVAIQ